jgi:hypothetical protein
MILITVETDMFEHSEVQPHFINPHCFGEDFAGWLIRQLSPLSNFGFTFFDPIQEDYGWGFWVFREKDRFWVAISYVGNGPQEGPVQWVISVNYDAGLNLIKRLFHTPDRQTLDQLKEYVMKAVTSNTAIRIVTTPRYRTDISETSRKSQHGKNGAGDAGSAGDTPA